MTPKFTDNDTLGRFLGDATPVQPEELKAAYQRIEELKASLAEMLAIYWGEGDGIHPPPKCIQRAMAALHDEVTPIEAFPEGACSL